VASKIQAVSHGAPVVDRPDAPAGPLDPDAFASAAEEAAIFLKTMAHDGRLMILCTLAAGERSVTELETLLLSRQSAVSQQLARLRIERIVKTRRDGKTIYYSLKDPRAIRLLGFVYESFCGGDDAPEKR
jgi:DNA-binding transcriptional ArsR family regulator